MKRPTLATATLVCVLLAPFLLHRESTAAAQVPAPVQAAGPSEAAVDVSPSALVDADEARAAGLSLDVLKLAVDAVECGVASGDLVTPPTLTVIDYSLPSTEPRLWVFDTHTHRLLFKELVAHGKGTGENMAEHFSDAMNSHQSSLGLFVTRDPYIGNNGYSLRLDGLEPGFNSHARDRAIVIHGAAYVSADFATRQGRLGRSWGCPALREAVARQVIDTVRDGGVVFSYYPDPEWLTRSRFLNCHATTGRVVATN